MENQIKKKQSKTTNGIQRESKDIQCNIKAKQRIQRKKGGEKQANQSKTKSVRGKKTDHDKSSKGNTREQAKQKLKQKQSKITDKQCKAMVGKHYKRANPSKAMEERKEQRVK